MRMNKNIRIMVVDDEPIVGKRLKQLLGKEGYSVESFTEGSTALNELEQQSYDIIVTDIKMEGIDGMKILEIAKMRHPDTKVIIITGFGKKKTACEALSKGAFDFILKPFKIQELKQIIKKAEMDSVRDIKEI